MGIDARHGALSWVLALPGRALAAAPLRGAFVVCDDSGVLRLLEASGARQRWQAQLAEPRRRGRAEPALTGCSLGVGSVQRRERVASNESDAAATPLLEQLAGVLSLADRGLVDAQRFLSRELAARPEPEATRVLIDLATRRSADPILQVDAEDLLATRRNGAEFMLGALASTSPSGPDPLALAPLGPLADALGALGERRAAPLLAEQLNHPGHSAGAIARAAAALEQLASEAEYANLSVFFSLHRTIADQPERIEAVNAIGRTLLRIGGERGRTLVQQAARDPLTVTEVRQELTRALGEAPASKAPPTGRHGAVALGRKGG
jgi:outer membrane protein assembly factor BamB